MIFNKQLHYRWRCHSSWFSFLLYCFFLFWWVLDGCLQFKLKQKTVMETGCFLLNKGMKNSLMPFLITFWSSTDRRKFHTVLSKVVQVHVCIHACEFLLEDLYIGLRDNILTYAYVWKMERTISCSNACYKPIVSTWSSCTLISLYNRTLWNLKNRLIKLIFSSRWQQPGRHYSRRTMDNLQEQD